MQEKKTLLLTILIIQTVIIFILIFVIVWLRQYAREYCGIEYANDVLQWQPEASTVKKVPLTTTVSATIVWWDQDDGFDSVKENYKLIDSLSPFWFELDMQGDIQPFTGANDASVIEYAKKYTIKLTPIISNELRAEPVIDIISDAEKREQHIHELVDIAGSYDGISLNYENLDAENKEKFSQFVTELASELHQQDKTLEIHLHAKTEEPGTWNGPQAQDWEVLGDVCDSLKIMAYDYHWSTSEAGAIAPADWVEVVITHGVELMPEEKIFLGIPLYGYDWIDTEGEGVTYDQVQDLINLHEISLASDTDTQYPYFTYTDNQELEHEVWFENADTVEMKLQLAESYDLGGIDLFRLGGEDAKVWERIGTVFKE